VAETKSQGAKAMFDQSLVYLLKAYRDEGMSADQAREQVSKDIAEVEKKHVTIGVLPERKKSLIDPVELVEDIAKTIDPLKTKNSILYRAIMQKVIRLKQNLQQRS